MTTGEIKKTALKALENKWGTAIGSVAAQFGISALLSGIVNTLLTLFTTLISVASGIYYLGNDLSVLPPLAVIPYFVFSIVLGIASGIISSNIALGVIKVFLKIANGENTSITDMFSLIKSGLKSGLVKPFLLLFMIDLKIILWMLPLYLPGCILIGISAVLSHTEPTITSTLLLCIGVLMALGSVILAMIAAFRYSMAAYVLVEKPETGIMDCIRTSKKIMKGNKAELFILELSFIGWHILAILTCGIGYIVLAPYISTATAVFYKSIKGDYDAPYYDNGYNAYGNVAYDNTFNAGGVNVNGASGTNGTAFYSDNSSEFSSLKEKNAEETALDTPDGTVTEAPAEAFTRPPVLTEIPETEVQTDAKAPNETPTETFIRPTAITEIPKADEQAPIFDSTASEELARSAEEAAKAIGDNSESTDSEDADNQRPFNG